MPAFGSEGEDRCQPLPNDEMGDMDPDRDRIVFPNTRSRGGESAPVQDTRMVRDADMCRKRKCEPILPRSA